MSKSILFVCYGNICRSPALQAVCEDCLRKRGITDWHIDSCGVSESFLGSPVDARMQRELRKRGIDFSHTSRPLEQSDFKIFDYIFVISHPLAAEVRAYAPPDAREKIVLVTHYLKESKDVPIPDPYFSTQGGFAKVLDLIEKCIESILDLLSKYA